MVNTSSDLINTVAYNGISYMISTSTITLRLKKLCQIIEQRQNTLSWEYSKLEKSVKFNRSFADFFIGKSPAGTTPLPRDCIAW